MKAQIKIKTSSVAGYVSMVVAHICDMYRNLVSRWPTSCMLLLVHMLQVGISWNIYNTWCAINK